MYRAILFSLFISIHSFAQTNDYQLYSLAIDNTIDQWDPDRDSITQVVIIEKLVPDWHTFNMDGLEHSSFDNEILYSALNYDKESLEDFNLEAIKTGIRTLEKEFADPPLLKPERFRLKTPVITITAKKFQSHFKSLFGDKVSKGWRKFYRRHPNTLGVFEFSKVIHTGDYAVFYMDHSGGGTLGSSDLIIFRKQENTWKQISILNISMS